ncbi:MAG TPA: hypothetical protein VGC13_08425 [Longimicrobium sp.]|jgi:hypothetical protein|uniref:hypothetical protein n=1 Tax=Longimicrobium sp. TaxID=2029185 RepID=UPI002ED9EF91
MKHATLLLAAVLAPAIASCDRAPSPTAARTADEVTILETGTANASAVGVARYVFGATTAHLSFIVNNSSTSVTTGKALYYSSAADIVMDINVTCLHKSGGTATFLGTINESNDTSIEGKDAYWQVVDGSPDQASIVSLADPGQGPSCTTPGEFDLVNIAAGTIIIS